MSIEGQLRTSLQVWHPDATVAEISALLGRSPAYFGEKGTSRGTSHGRRLADWTTNYWSADYTRGEDLEARIAEMFDGLGDRVDRLASLLAHGGRACFAVYFVVGKSTVLEVSPATMKKLGELGIELAFDLAAARTPPTL